MTPLPTSTTGPPSPPPWYSRVMNRGSCAEPCATASRAPIPSFLMAARSSTVTFTPCFLPSATAWSARYVGVQTLPGSICRCRVYRAPAAIAAPMRRPASASLASLASTTTSTASTSTRGSSPACLRSVKIQAPCAAPSTASWPQSRALTPPRASAATSSAKLLAPSTRARLAATAAARRRLVRVTSALLPIPTTSRRWILPAAGYSSWVSSRLPLKSPPAIARAITPPVARSRAASDAGTVVPAGTITARRGVSRSPAGVVTMALFMGGAGLSPRRRRRSRPRWRQASGGPDRRSPAWRRWPPRARG